MRPHRKSRAAPGPRLPGLPRLRVPGLPRPPSGLRRAAPSGGPRRPPPPGPATAPTLNRARLSHHSRLSSRSLLSSLSLLSRLLRLPRLRRHPALTGGAVAALVLLLLSGTDPLRGFLDFTGGVLSLVSLTAAVVWGLVAAGRTVLLPRSRLLAQGVHRALATSSLGFLVLHIAVKVAEEHAHALNALLPFTATPAPGASVLIGFGATAGYLMLLAAATGALRSAFAGRGRASERWRALHACAYPAWCLALVHGLKSGRSPSGWVTAAYVLCLAAVAAALLARAFLPHVLRARLRAGTATAPPPAQPPPPPPHLPLAPTPPYGSPALRPAPAQPAYHGRSRP
ncbi:hypothetical protein [Streptomyces sp. NPDC059788]|uniref:hypothetical protein n=1 Tax=Streptomyces sp. NPDC059788 TaxID=3346948 RepID=UPI00366367B8